MDTLTAADPFGATTGELTVTVEYRAAKTGVIKNDVNSNAIQSTFIYPPLIFGL